jgi:alpha-L-rhamnosidase
MDLHQDALNRFILHSGESMPRAAAPAAPRFEHRTDDGPVLGIGTATPRLSWVVPTADPDFRQDAYELQLTRGSGSESQTVRVDSAEQVLVPWPFEPLQSREAAMVRVRVAHGDAWSEWSPPAVVEAGLLRPEDWSGSFVTPQQIGGLDMPALVLRATLNVPDDVATARLYATAHGVYVATVNGQRVGDEVLAPGWTAYQHRLRYQTYDVTQHVQSGQNVLEVLLGNGWYRGRLGFAHRRALYGDRLGLLAQLEVVTADGARHVLPTDTSWSAHESNIVSDDLYDGQRTDLRTTPDPAKSYPVETTPGDPARLVAPDGPPVRVTEVVAARSVTTSPSGRTLVDFGQNVVGWVRLRVRGLPEGHEVVVRHAEVLEDGELGTRPLRTAQATDSYVLAGNAEETLEPELTFHGFRFAEVQGIDSLQAGDVHAVVIGSDLRRTGWFESSHPELNRFHENVVWGMRGNFVDVPTDCPQRDERLGWTGDIQVFSPTATFLFDSTGFLTSWLADLTVEQSEEGAVPFVVPDILFTPNPSAAAWGDAATLVPWVLYQRTGDAAVLSRQLPSMRAWVDRLVDLAGPGRLWTGGFQFGDWLDPTAPPDNPFGAQADPDVVATAHFARSAEVVAQAAEVVGDRAAAERYAALAAEVRDAFAREYVTPGGRVLSDAPTVYALALQWALLPSQDQRVRAGRRLADLVRTAGFRISTGFVGTPLVTDALTSVGELRLAYRLLLQTGCPSWLYAVTMGATTVWERWDSMLPDGSINPGQMTSFNHYALGAVADWLHRTVAGLAPAEPGYRTLRIEPKPDAALGFASARHLTPYGEAAVAWTRDDGRLTVRVTVPVGSTATVVLPGAVGSEVVRHGQHSWTVADPCAAEPDLKPEANVRDVLDHPRIWNMLVDAAVAEGVAADESDLARRLKPLLDYPASELIDRLVDYARGTGRDALHARLDPVLRAGG